MTPDSGEAGRNRLYDDLAYLWPTISPPEHYADEAPHWRNQLLSRLAPGARRVLDIGSGGGHHLSHLTDLFEVTAVDLSERMLANSRRLNPNIAHAIGDMRSVRLNRVFDAVLIHDAIAYMTTEDDLSAAFTTARAHLEPGGVFITAPDHYADTFRSPYISHETNRRDDTEVTLIEYSSQSLSEPSLLETVFMFVVTEGGERRIELDRHTTGLFPRDTWRSLIEGAGFRVERIDYPVNEDGPDLYLWVGTASG